MPFRRANLLTDHFAEIIAWAPSTNWNDIMAKAKVDLDSLNLDQLLALREQIESRVETIASSELAALEEKMNALKPFAGKRRSSGVRSKAPVKFRDPKTGKTWSGRGMTPVWLRDYEEAGKKRESFAV